MTMKIHDLIQGSAEWLAYRAQHFNASDAPAMMGCSPYMTRNELLTRMKTGITSEVDAGTQRRFDDGHRFEALARPLAEKIVGGDLYPVTGSLGELSASFDGITLDDTTLWEHKSLNDDLRRAFDDIDTIAPEHRDTAAGKCLPLHHRVQMEQQLLVAKAGRVLFMATKWASDNVELIEERHCWYTSDPDLRAQIVAGWKQFAADLAVFVPEAKAAPVVAAPVETLPAVSVKVNGALAIVSNLPDFGAALRNFIERIPAQPSTDQEFADTEAACKALKRAEEALEAAESNALAQLSDVDTMRRLVADFKALARTTRLQREKLVTARKDAIRGEIVAGGVAALAKHVRELNAAMPADYMPTVPADFGGAIKGLRTIDSIRNAVDTELARAKIAASDIATKIHANLGKLDAANAPMLFAYDIKSLVLKAPDDLAAIIAQRLAAEEKRKEAERARIRAEEAARLEREILAEQREQQRQAEITASALISRQQEAEKASNAQNSEAQTPQQVLKAEAPAPDATARGTSVTPSPSVGSMGAGQAADAAPDDGSRLTLGQINERLAPVSITVAGLSELGFEPVAKDKASRLYRACDLPKICRAIADRVLAAAVLEAA